ncbi:MAG: type II secretion system protein N [Mariprofundaceae bacterium]|nr:type II secretion system protein N [Mariprofundaceae bacterium]
MVMLLEQLKGLLLSHGLRWLEYVLVLLSAWMVAGFLLGNTAEQRASSGVYSAAVAQLDKQDSSSNLHLEILKNTALFGDANQVTTEQPVTPLIVQQSKLNIKLVGTVVAGERSAAVVTINGSKEQLVFFVHDEVQPGVKLIGVEVLAIVLDNRGQQERISIEEGKALVASMQVRNLPKVQPRGRLNRKVERRIDRGKMQTELRDFSKLLSQARVTPHFTNKKADGFTISEIVKGSLYEQIGLANGDIIRKVNGESVVSAEQAMRMYKELQSATNIDVEIERGGSIQQVSYSIQ